MTSAFFKILNDPAENGGADPAENVQPNPVKNYTTYVVHDTRAENPLSSLGFTAVVS